MDKYSSAFARARLVRALRFLRSPRRAQAPRRRWTLADYKPSGAIQPVKIPIQFPDQD